MSNLDDAAELLRSGPIADVGQLLKPGGVRQIADVIARVQTGGRHAHLVITPLGQDLTPWHGLWERLGYRPSRDLLLLFNGQRWEARGWNLSAAAIDHALDSAAPDLRQYYGKGLATALENLAHAAQGSAPAPAAPATGGGAVLPTLAGLGAAAALAGLGWVIVRRRRRAQERRRTLAEARRDADKVFADVVLASEDLPTPEGANLREKATRLHEQIEALAPPNLKQLPAKEETLTLAKLLQAENELEALRSTVLQVKRRP